MDWYDRQKRTARTADPSPDASGPYPDAMPDVQGLPSLPQARKRRRRAPDEARPVSTTPAKPRVPATPAAEGALPNGAATSAPNGATSR